MDLFFLKKLIGTALMPLSIVIFLLIIAIFFYKTRKKLSFFSLLSATTLLIFSSLTPVSQTLITSLESKYPVYNISNEREHDILNYIVVLGCYHFSDANLPATIELKTCSLQRLVEAIRLANLYPEATLIFSGSAGHNPQSNAKKMKEAAVLMGINEERILMQHKPRDTQHEARLIAPQIIGKKAVLITNADHMHRSLNYFIHQGASPIPAPASFYAKGDITSTDNVSLGSRFLFYFPKSHSLETTTVYWYERLGLIAQWFNHLMPARQKTNKPPTDNDQEINHEE